MKIKLVNTLLLLMCSLGLLGQESLKFPLRVGDKMPEIVFHTMVNYPGGKAKLSDFKGKPVILDLWHVQCTACIEGMPKMQELQRKFNGQIQIIGFGMNSIADYKKLRKNSSILKEITTLPLALQADTPLFKNLVGIFPRHIWIDKDGIIRAVTSTLNASENHIQNFVNGKPLTFIMEKANNAFDKYYPTDTSLLVQGNGKNLNRLLYHSLFSRRVDFDNGIGTGGSSSNYVNVGPEKPGIRTINATLMSSINLVYHDSIQDISSYHVVLEAEDLQRFIAPSNVEEYDQWRQKNTYCYELSLPEGRVYSRETVLKYLRQDMQRFFGVKIVLKPHLTNCLILYRLDDKDRIKTMGMPHDKEYNAGMNYGNDFRNVPINEIRGNIQIMLSWHKVPVKVIDETNYFGNVDMKFDHKLDDIDLVRASLRKYGLGLKEAQRMVNCIVISKAN